MRECGHDARVARCHDIRVAGLVHLTVMHW
jgi:hypothetical protein